MAMKYPTYCARCANRGKDDVCKTCGHPYNWFFPTRFAQEMEK